MSAYTRYDKDHIVHVGGIKYQIRQPLIWRIGSQFGPAYIVRSGRIFDVSIPFFLRFLLSPHDPRFLKAAALHDDMLAIGLCDDDLRKRLPAHGFAFSDIDQRLVARVEDVRWSREEAAGAFAAALRADGVCYFLRLMMHVAVVFWTTR